MVILYLYSELMGYQIPVLREYVTIYNAKVHVVHWNHKKLTPYEPVSIEGVSYYKRSDYNKTTLLALSKELKPDVVYVSGWMDKEYLKVCSVLKKNGVPIVAGCDTQWKGNIRQQLGRFYFKWFLKKSFSYLWIAGAYQYEYAVKLGFRKSEILFNCYSADVNLFTRDAQLKEANYPHNFLYVGRFDKVKGLEVLLKSWNSVNKKDWTLTLIGNGVLKEELLKRENIIVKEFMQPEELSKEIDNAGCFILPSLYEPWALVIHEFVAGGLPIIASDVCGAAPLFITPNYNGFVFKSGDQDDLSKKMETIINMTDDQLLAFSKNSLLKSKNITPSIVAATFISVI
jgi:glycosyltransferase involved in cell wall biosynthesis